jgi:uncharacterized membrane protein YfcA
MNLTLFIIGMTATLTAAVSSTLGLAGGLILLSVLTLFMDLQTAIPLHGFAQLCSNVGRVAHFHKYIDWKITSRFSLLILPGAYLGIKTANLLNKNFLAVLIGFIMIISVYKKPSEHQWMKNTHFFTVLGFVSSFIGVIAGATGPMIVPFFMGIGLNKNQMVGTKAICQSLIQLVKLPAFSIFSGFILGNYLQYFGLFILAAIVGTFLGKKLIEKLSEDRYELIIRSSVALLAIQQIMRATFHLLQH